MGNRVKNSAFIWGMSTSRPYKGYARGRSVELNSSDVAYLQENATMLEALAPRNQLGGWRGGNNVSHGLKTAACGVYGDMPVYKDIDPIVIQQGRYINQRDLDEKRKVAVIGKRVRQLLFDKDEHVLGSNVQVQGVNFTVVGVFRSQQTGEDAEESENNIFTPYTTFNKAFNMGDRVGWLSVLIREDASGEDALDEVLSLLKARLSIHPDDRRAFGNWSMAERHEEMTTVFSAFRWVSFVFGGLALFAGSLASWLSCSSPSRSAPRGSPWALRHTSQHCGPNHGGNANAHCARGSTGACSCVCLESLDTYPFIQKTMALPASSRHVGRAGDGACHHDGVGRM